MEESRQRDISANTTSSDEQLLSSILRSSDPYPNPDPKQQKQQDQAQPPSPFTPLPSTSPLISFLETLTDRSKIYIIHVDTTPPAVKRRVFAIPLILNSVIVGLLLWRVWVMIPFYATVLRILPAKPNTFDARDGVDMFSPDTGIPSPDEVGRSEVPGKFHPSTLLLILHRTLIFFIDYILFFHVAAWPYSFFAEGSGNPTYWRFWALRGRFRDMEVVVRKSRGWGVEELRQTGSSSLTTSTTKAAMSNSKSSGIIQGYKSPYFHMRITPMVRRSYLRNMTGYMMMGQYWDLDFEAMARVVGMLDESEIDINRKEKNGLTLEDFRTVVVLWDESEKVAGIGGSKSRANAAAYEREKNGNDSGNGQWLSWRVF